MKKILTKSVLAVAITAMSGAALAAGTFVTVPTAERPVILANEIFGTNSEETPIATPRTLYTVDATKNAVANAEVATIKLTLNKGAVFADDLSTIDKWAGSLQTKLIFSFDAGATTVTVGGSGSPYVQDADWDIKVDQGGTIGSNNVIFKITNTSGAAGVLDSVDTQQIAVKALKAALARGVANPQVNLGVEFRNVNTSATDTAPSVVVFKSQDGVAFGKQANGYADPIITEYTAGNTAAGRARINVGSAEKKFTNDRGTFSAKDFDPAGDTAWIDFGSLNVVRTKIFTNTDEVKKENGDDFDFNSDDEPVVTFSNENSFDAYSRVYLRPNPASACTDTVVGGDKSVTPAAGAKSVAINLKGQTTTELENGYRVCAVAKTNVAIPEDTFTASLAVTYFNPRYTDSKDEYGYKKVLRNGCSVTLFNLPPVTADDKAFIRLTNISDIQGTVRASVYNEAGTKTQDTTPLDVTVPAHGTVILTNDSEQTGNANRVYLGDKLTAYADDAVKGRSRIILQGAFPACEAMGLVRSNGLLINMTDTTYSGDDSKFGTQANGTSNTTN